MLNGGKHLINLVGIICFIMDQISHSVVNIIHSIISVALLKSIYQMHLAIQHVTYSVTIGSINRMLKGPEYDHGALSGI